VNVFLALNESRVAAIGFPTNQGRMDYRGFVSEDPQVHSWARTSMKSAGQRARQLHRKIVSLFWKENNGNH